MGATLAGLLISSMFFTGALMMFRTTLQGNVVIGDTTRESIRIAGERARTEISITSVVGSGCGLTITVDNTGAISIADASRMDIIVQYPAGNNSAQRLTYDLTGPPDIGEWIATSISGQFQPAIFDPGETMTIDAQLSLVEAGPGTVTVGSHNGIIDTGAFSTSTPC